MTVTEAARLIDVSLMQVLQWAKNENLKTNGNTGNERHFIVTLASASAHTRRRRDQSGNREDQPVGWHTGHRLVSPSESNSERAIAHLIRALWATFLEVDSQSSA